MQDETTYILEPTAFHSMTEAQVLTDQLEQNLSELSNVTANIKPQVVEMFSEMVNNAAEHGMSNTGAHCHVRLMPHRKGLALDSVITDRGPGIRADRANGVGGDGHNQGAEPHPAAVEREEPRPAGGIRRTGPQARRPGTHLRHRQSHQGHRSLDHLPGMPEARQELRLCSAGGRYHSKKLHKGGNHDVSYSIAHEVHSGTGRLSVYGPDSVEFSTTLDHQGTTVRFTIPT